jgi:glycosyltransferase involved in cell wall biosynthesis
LERIAIVDTSFPVNSRNDRLRKSLEKNYSVDVYSWSRTGQVIGNVHENDFIFKKRSPVGAKFTKLMNLLLYYKFLRDVIAERKPSLIIASHWDSLLLCSLLNKKKNFKIVYDNIDMPDSKWCVVRKLLCLIEGRSLRRVAGVIYASRFFAQHYSLTIESLIYENYVTQSYLSMRKLREPKQLFYIGTVRHRKILQRLMDACESLGIDLQVYGDGPALTKLKKYKETLMYQHTYFYGRFDYQDLRFIYDKCDYIWAAYPSDSFNVKYAISNKFFETLAYKKVGIFSKKTELGKLVTKHELGLVVDEVNDRSILDVLNVLSDKVNYNHLIQCISAYEEKHSISWRENEYRLLNYIQDVLIDA